MSLLSLTEETIAYRILRNDSFTCYATTKKGNGCKRKCKLGLCYQHKEFVVPGLKRLLKCIEYIYGKEERLAFSLFVMRFVFFSEGILKTYPHFRNTVQFKLMEFFIDPFVKTRPNEHNQIKKYIDKLEDFKVKYIGEEECCVCMETMNKCTVMICQNNHAIHTSCFIQLHQKKCPLCRVQTFK